MDSLLSRSCCRPATACVLIGAALVGCGGSTRAATIEPVPGRLDRRVSALEAAVARWAAAATVRDGHEAAETVRNLIVGSAGPLYGDGDRNGSIAGAASTGVLPGLSGEAGLASATQNECVQRDVLGGSWADPQARWAELRQRIADWRPQNNTFPPLASHPQRSVGWATLALATADPDRIAEYAGHAALHIEVLRDALGCETAFGN